MSKKILALSLLTLFMASCANVTQKDWHIKTFKLADEYFPKYFEAIEESLSKNDIEYEKEYSEEIRGKNKYKNYRCVYNVSENIYFKFDYEFDRDSSNIEGDFVYKLVPQNEIFNLSQSYINVMIDVVNFCSYNFFETGEMYNTWYEEVKEKYLKQEISDVFAGYSLILTGETYEDLLPSRGINMYFLEEEYYLSVYLRDYITDVNIWNK